MINKFKSVKRNILQREKTAAITRERKWQGKQINQTLFCKTVKKKTNFEEE